jgi:hypothetical protein
MKSWVGLMKRKEANMAVKCRGGEKPQRGKWGGGKHGVGVIVASLSR